MSDLRDRYIKLATPYGAQRRLSRVIYCKDCDYRFHVWRLPRFLTRWVYRPAMDRHREECPVE